MVNKIVLVGRLGRNAELREVNDTHVCSFSMATSETWKDRNGQKQENTQWHNIVLWGKLGPAIHQYLLKGSLVYVEGTFRTREYTSKEGEKRTAYEVIASQLRLLGDSKPRGTGKGGRAEDEPDEGAGYQEDPAAPDADQQNMGWADLED